MYYPIRSYDFPSLCGDRLVRFNKKKNSELVKSILMGYDLLYRSGACVN